MLSPIDIDYLARKERHKDLIREAEQTQLVYMATSQREHQETHRRIASWVGVKMVKLGSKLSHYSDASSSNHKRSNLAS